MRYSILDGKAEDRAEDVKGAGGQNVREIKNSPIVYADLDEAQVEQLRIKGYTVSKMQTITPPVSTPVPVPVSGAPVYTPTALLEMLGIEEFRQMTSPPLTGVNKRIAVIGTGVRASHIDIGGRVIYSKNYTSSPDGDGFDHDTGVAAIIHAVVPDTDLLDLKVVSDSGSGTEEALVMAVDDCISMHQEGHEFAPDILNMSLGAVDDGNPYNSIRVICRSAIDEGLWLVASAGNSGPAPYTITSPACEKYVMAIGSCRQDPFSISDFSSRGPTPEGLTKPDAVMLGEDIIMASSKSDSATLAKSGTSFSAPFASAAASLFLNGQDVWGDFSKAPGMPEFLRRQVPYPMTQEGLIDVFLPATGIKPSGSIMGKDNIYGYGLPYAPLLFEKVSAAADVSSLLGGVLMIGMMGMMMRYMTKVRV